MSYDTPGRPPKIFPEQKYGFLTVIEEGSRDKHKNRKWLCRCVCGKEKEYYAWQLSTGDSISCGCKKGGNHSTSTKGKRLK